MSIVKPLIVTMIVKSLFVTQSYVFYDECYGLYIVFNPMYPWNGCSMTSLNYSHFSLLVNSCKFINYIYL